MDEADKLATLQALIKCRMEAIENLMQIEQELESGICDASTEERLRFLAESTDLLDTLTKSIKPSLDGD